MKRPMTAQRREYCTTAAKHTSWTVHDYLRLNPQDDPDEVKRIYSMHGRVGA